MAVTQRRKLRPQDTAGYTAGEAWGAAGACEMCSLALQASRVPELSRALLCRLALSSRNIM